MFRTVLTLLFAASIAEAAAPTATEPTYILNGFRLSGVKGVNTDEMIARLKHKAGMRITEADMVADTEILGSELKARHIEGQLLTTMAEKNGRVWVLLDLQPPRPPAQLASQSFEGNTKIPSATLEAATGLKSGDELPADRLHAAEQAITRAYATAAPGTDVKIRGVMRRRADGTAVLTWTVTEHK
ncbi:MAG: hypothetical protein WDN04_14755 [Rhodospirillales bacterium]